jgi:hypothetical protein
MKKILLATIAVFALVSLTQASGAKDLVTCGGELSVNGRSVAIYDIEWKQSCHIALKDQKRVIQICSHGANCLVTGERGMWDGPDCPGPEINENEDSHLKWCFERITKIKSMHG